MYLSVEKQKLIKNEFVREIPWNNIGRKNIGYLYAIAHQAQTIWDFDDDNALKFWLKSVSPDQMLDLDTFVNNNFNCMEPDQHDGVVNPYLYLEAALATEKLIWPRGFPLDKIQSASKTTLCGSLCSKKCNESNFGVLQSLADYEPDVDAIYRLTRQTPINFPRPEIVQLKDLDELYRTHSSVLKIPTLAPYNAQATLHFYDAFWALYLPVTVHGRVSDIWRSYFSQAIFKRLNIQVGYLPRPLVVQERNLHLALKDFEAETPLYLKASALTKYLSSQVDEILQSSDYLPDLIQALWIDMYERDYIEIEDVYLVQKWLKTLLEIGYKFPQLGSEVYESYHKSIASDWNPCYSVAEQKNPEDDDNNIRLTFATADLHDGCLADQVSVLSHLKQNVLQMSIKGPIQTFPSVNRMPGVVVYQKYSSTLRKFVKWETNITDQMIQKHLDFYKNDPVIEAVDAFVCSFPPKICQLWIPFNKSIVFWPAHRYNLGLFDTESWQKFNRQIMELSQNPKNVIAAASKYDLEYLKYHLTGLISQPKLIPSFSGFYLDDHTYIGHHRKSKEFLVSTSQNPIDKKFLQMVIKPSKDFKKDFKISSIEQVLPHYQASDLVKYSGYIFFPYATMTYKITEAYTMGIPIFVPTLKFLAKLRGSLGFDSLMPDKGILPNKMKLIKELALHPYSPDVTYTEDPEAEVYWMQFTDFYQWPYIQLFDNFEELYQLLEECNLEEISQNMLKEVQLKRTLVKKAWTQVVRVIKENKDF